MFKVTLLYFEINISPILTFYPLVASAWLHQINSPPEKKKSLLLQLLVYTDSMFIISLTYYTFKQRLSDHCLYIMFLYIMIEFSKTTDELIL